MTQKCYRCKEIKDIELFCKDKYKKSGYGFICKPCKMEYTKVYMKTPGAIARRKAVNYRKTERYKKYIKTEAGKLYLKRKIERSPEKFKARAMVKYNVRVGKLKKLPCRDCGDINTHGHHADYSKPLDVIWLCRKHHHEEHMRLKELSPASE